MKRHTTIFLLLSLMFIVGCEEHTNEHKGEEKSITKQNRNVPGLGLKRGLTLNSKDAAPGYILFNPNSSGSTWLMNREGQILHEWKGYFHSWLAYLMDDGSVIRNAVAPDAPVFYAGGMAGRIEEISNKSEVTWQFEYATEDYQVHHDIAVLPNGNVLSISYDHRSKEELVEAGRKSEFIPKDGLWFEKIIEVKPIKPSGGEIVWEWRFWDHLVQDQDPSKPNYGVVADNP